MCFNQSCDFPFAPVRVIRTRKAIALSGTCESCTAGLNQRPANVQPGRSLEPLQPVVFHEHGHTGIIHSDINNVKPGWFASCLSSRCERQCKRKLYDSQAKHRWPAPSDNARADL